MNNNPLISVVIPTYNRMNSVCNAIDSVLNQTYSNIEIIVVDDGSTDNTANRLEQYGDKIKYIKQINGGVSSARNTGIRSSEGEYLAFLDSDDIWYDDKIEKQMKFFQDNEDSILALVYVDVIRTSGDGKTIESRRPYDRNRILGFIDVFIYPYLGPSTVLLKTECINKEMAFDESLKTAEDLQFFLEIASKYNIGYLNEVLGEIRHVDDGLSSSTDSYIDNINVVTRFFDDKPELFIEYKEHIKEILFRINYDYARTLLWYKQSRQCRQRLNEAHKHKIKAKSILLYLKSFLVF